jgi:succinate-semialdehyde dehydrogenase/glutarate-semialdehyde dehydrogenase
MAFVAIDPCTGEKISEHPGLSGTELEGRLAGAARAYEGWREVPVAGRVEPLRALARLLRDGKEEHGRLMTREMGKPISQAIAEAEKCAWACEYYADHAADFLEPVGAETDASRSYWTYRPLGVVLGIMPWNFPFWQAMRFAAPAVTAGNAALLKHASNVPGCALALERLFEEAGFPHGVFTNLFIDSDTAGDVIDDPRVRGVSLTGSVSAGRAVGSRAAQALKKCVLELGGSDPALVLEDADLDAAAEGCALGRLQNNGQSCIATKRFVVVDAVRDAFTAKVRAEMEAWTMGDPSDPDTRMGPLARQDLRDELHDQVERSVAAGARILLGGEVPERAGAWYPPTILTDVRPGMPAYEDELFGPVAAIVPVADEAEAIRVANDTVFGLGASVYTRDTDRGERIAAELIDAGSCFVNGIVKSDPRLPFGGTKASGYGRELSPLGILEFTNVKTVWVR